MDYVKISKALGDNTRIAIMHMLATGEKCGCKLLEEFQITQPTLSHHMKVLVESELVNDHKVGKWHHYSLNNGIIQKYALFLESLILKGEE